jgi:hypothetical protein
MPRCGSRRRLKRTGMQAGLRFAWIAAPRSAIVAKFADFIARDARRRGCHAMAQGHHAFRGHARQAGTSVLKPKGPRPNCSAAGDLIEFGFTRWEMAILCCGRRLPVSRRNEPRTVRSTPTGNAQSLQRLSSAGQNARLRLLLLRGPCTLVLLPTCRTPSTDTRFPIR